MGMVWNLARSGSRVDFRPLRFAGKTETLREFRYKKIRYVHAIRGKLSGDSTKQPASALPLTD